jgi:hypothetical protein
VRAEERTVKSENLGNRRDRYKSLSDPPKALGVGGPDSGYLRLYSSQKLHDYSLRGDDGSPGILIVANRDP